MIGPWWRTWTGLLTAAALALGAVYLSVVHVDHVLKALPLLLVLACPLMHLFMHGGHRGHDGHADGHRDNNSGSPGAGK